MCEAGRDESGPCVRRGGPLAHRSMLVEGHQGLAGYTHATHQVGLLAPPPAATAAAALGRTLAFPTG